MTPIHIMHHEMTKAGRVLVLKEKFCFGVLMHAVRRADLTLGHLLEPPPRLGPNPVSDTRLPYCFDLMQRPQTPALGRRCNLNLKARWNVGKWRAPTPALGPRRGGPNRRGLGFLLGRRGENEGHGRELGGSGSSWSALRATLMTQLRHRERRMPGSFCSL